MAAGSMAAGRTVSLWDVPLFLYGTYLYGWHMVIGGNGC